MTTDTLPHASLEVICGCMFSGKSEELMRRARRAIIAKQKVVVFKPTIDDRYHPGKVKSHCGGELDAIRIPEKTPDHILRYVIDGEWAEGPPDVVVIDEVQFFAKGIVKVIEQLVNAGIRVIVAGLDLYATGESFGEMPLLLVQADDVLKLSAICTICGRAATRTQKLTPGPGVEVGAADKYAARCRDHHSPEPESN